MFFLLRLLLPFLLVVIVLEEEQREHSQDTADADTDGFALRTGSEERMSILVWSIYICFFFYTLKKTLELAFKS